LFGAFFVYFSYNLYYNELENYKQENRHASRSDGMTAAKQAAPVFEED